MERLEMNRTPTGSLKKEEDGWKKEVPLATFKLLVSVASLLAALYIFAAFAHEVFLEKEDELDVHVLRWLKDRFSDGTFNLMRFFTFFGKPHFLVPAYMTLIGLYLARGKKAIALEIAITAVSSTLLLFGLKQVFRRDRPHLPIFEHLPGYSFPSGHALMSFVFCSLLIVLIWRDHWKDGWKWTLTIFLILFSLVIGISRIILQVHYASDVICGFCLGYVWVFLSFWLLRKMERKMGDRKKEK
ncbi:phosphatase PAP2 family protein [Paraflavisolibacter sp. H34]|uniref:phosphatase PAP2 family protein n=1 Tax=Huijunlia imazamoxiresistens TaxID=3127457 RepID=UPI003016DA58